VSFYSVVVQLFVKGTARRPSLCQRKLYEKTAADLVHFSRVTALNADAVTWLHIIRAYVPWQIPEGLAEDR
jgi:hypothetical protein